MEAVSFLVQYHKCEVLIQNKQTELVRWRDIAGSIGSFQITERVQSSGSQSKMADAIAEYTAIEEEIKMLKDKQRDILNVIESLGALQYDILYKIYVQTFTLPDIADLYTKSRSWAYKKHTAALNSVQKILNERTENLTNK